MKHIAFIFTNGDSLMSKLIRLQTWGQVNHSAFEFVEDNFIVQIQHPKVLVVHPSALIDKSKVLYRFVMEVDDEGYEKALTFAREKLIGKNYDWFSVARFAIPLRAALGRLEPVTRKATEANWFCSEGCEVLGRKAGAGLVRNTKAPAKVSPELQFSSKILESCALYQVYEKGDLLYSGEYVEDF